MGQNLPLCGQLVAARSRQGESKEVGGAWVVGPLSIRGPLPLLGCWDPPLRGLFAL